MDTLFRIAHTGSFNVSIQALILVSHVVTSSRSGADALVVRFYRALYDSLLDTRLAHSSKQALYLNMLFKAMRADTSVARSAAFVKRLVQTLGSHQPPFICGALHLLGEMRRSGSNALTRQVIAASPALRSMLTDPEDDDGDEHFVDAPTEPVDDAASDADEDAAAPKADAGGYDARKREPLYAKAQSSCLWELVRRRDTASLTLQIPLTRHWHPAVALHATELLSGQRPSTESDLEQHTLSRFLDRFAYRDVGVKTAVKGPSAMQPARAGADAGAVRLRRGAAPSQRDVVNDPSFWAKDVAAVPVDQLFFHRFFSRRERESRDKDAKKARRKRAREDGDEEGDAASVADGGVEDASDAGSLDEDEVFAAMMRSRGQLDGVEGTGLSDDGGDADADEDAAFAYSDDEADAPVEDDDDEDAMSAFGEDADDLQGSELEDDEAESLFPPETGAPTLTAAEVLALVSKPATDSRSRRDKRRKLKHLGTFATAEDWQAIIDGAAGLGDE